MKRFLSLILFLLTSYSLVSMEVNVTPSDVSIRVDDHTTVPQNSISSNPSDSGTARLRATKSALKSSRDGKIVPSDLNEVKQLVHSRSVRPGDEGGLRKRRTQKPTFSQTQMDQVHDTQQRQSKKLYTHAEVEVMYQQEKKRQSQVLYTEDEVVEILKQAASFDQPSSSLDQPLTSRIHRLGVKYNVPLEDLPTYAEILQDVEITPRVMLDFMYKHHGETDKVAPEYEVKGYEKLQRDKPHKYQECVFAMLQAMVDEVEVMQPPTGAPLPPVLVDTYAMISQRKVEQQDGAIRTRNWVIAGKFLVICGFAAWALYGQIAPHVAPVCHNITG